MRIPIRSARFAISLLVALLLIIVPVSVSMPGSHSASQISQRASRTKASFSLSVNGSTGSSKTSLPGSIENMGNIDVGFNVLRVTAVDSSNGNIYAVNQGSSIVSVIKGSTNNVFANISVGPSPYSCTFSPKENEVFVSDSLGISVISCKYNRVVSTIKTGEIPSSIIYDSFDNCVYASFYSSSNSFGYVLVINASTHQKLANITGINSTNRLFVDGANGFVYVLFTNSNFITIINGTSNTIEEAIALNGTVSWASYDPMTGDMYIGNGNSITVMNGTTNRIVANYALSGYVAGFVVDLLNGYIYEGQFAAISLSVISPENGSIVSNVNFAGYVSSMEYDPANNNIYVCGHTDTLYVFNATDNTFSTIDPGHYPQYVQYSPQHGLVYVSAPQSNKVLLINASENRIEGSIPVNGGPGGIAVDYVSNMVYVSDQGSGTVKVINGTTNRVAKNISAGTTPNGIVFDPRAGLMFVMNYGSDNITVINGSTSTATKTINLTNNPNSNAPYDGVWDSTNNEVYVTNQLESNITVINAGNSTQARSIDVGASVSGIAIDTANSLLYASCTDINKVDVINASTGKVVANITVGSNPAGISYDPYSGLIYVADSGSNNVDVISGRTEKVVAAINVGESPENIAFDSGNGYMYVSNHFSNSVSVVGAPSFNATFKTNGLRNATWSVHIEGPENLVSGTVSQSRYSFFIPDGLYSFDVTTSSSNLSAKPSSGNFSINSRNIVVTINITSPQEGIFSYQNLFHDLLAYSAVAMSASLFAGLILNARRHRK